MATKKQRAIAIVNNYVSSGRLKREACVVCGDEKSQGHHEDYDKPLDVIWLCKKHHEQVHHQNVKITTKEEKKNRIIIPMKPPEWVLDIKSTLAKGSFSPFVYAAIRNFMKLPEDVRKELTENETYKK